MSASVCKGISIRAPARGATSSHKRHVAGSRFQSALPRGERHNMVGYCQSHRDFNPRSREGSDDGTQLSVRYGCYFNPRSREGSDQSHKPRTAILQAFQSALPRGERRLIALLMILFYNFNPRSREGSDTCKGISSYQLKISIRAPARGATPVPAGQMQH